MKEALDHPGIDFVGKRYIAMTISGLMVLGCLIVIAVVGPNWGIDFTGGTEIKLAFEDGVEITEVRAALHTLGLGDDAVQQVGGGSLNEYDIRIQDASFGADELRANVLGALAASFGDDWVQSDSFDAQVGARLSVKYAGDVVTPSSVSEALSEMEGVVVEAGRDQNEMVIKMPGLPQLVQRSIQSAMGDRHFEVLSVDAVGPKVGGDLRRQGFLALAATLGLVLLYVGFRFDVAFAPGAILALAHDVIITMGIFVILQREVNLPMIGALLTIVGYSLNDTIVIYDRIRENSSRYARTDLTEMINVSVNETLSRTIGTSVTTLLAIVAFLFMGGPVIQNFALAMLLGIIFGTYSTVYVASPTIIAMQDVKPWLSRWMVTSGPGGNGEVDPDEDLSGLSESEKRRRQRAIVHKTDAG